MAGDQLPDYYAILELPLTADSVSIKASFHRLAKIRHPDKDGRNPNATAEFQQLQAAYSTLIDPNQRRRYDNRRRERGGGEAARETKEEATKKSSEEAAGKAREKEAQRAREEAAVGKAREEAARKAREEEATRAGKEAERKRKEETERKAREEGARRAREETERKDKEEAAQRAREEGLSDPGASRPTHNNTAREQQHQRVTLGSTAEDVLYPDPPATSICWVVFANKCNQLACASLDGDIRVYSEDMRLIGRSKLQGGIPTGCAWIADDSSVFGFGSDNTVEWINSGNPWTQVIGSHTSAVTDGRAYTNSGLSVLATGSLDMTVKYWNVGFIQPTGAPLLCTLQLPEGVCAMDVKERLLVIALVNNDVAVVDLDNPLRILSIVRTELNGLLHSIACFQDGLGFAVGGMEGRCAIQHVHDIGTRKPFTLDCHRTSPGDSSGAIKTWPVNAIAFHPNMPAFATAGGDGIFRFWDKETGNLLQEFPHVGESITSISFSPDGKYFVYGISYDWSQGGKGVPAMPFIAIKRHTVGEHEVRPWGGPEFEPATCLMS